MSVYKITEFIHNFNIRRFVLRILTCFLATPAHKMIPLQARIQSYRTAVKFHTIAEQY